jgi:hypothetical protein
MFLKPDKWTLDKVQVEVIFARFCTFLSDFSRK